MDFEKEARDVLRTCCQSYEAETRKVAAALRAAYVAGMREAMNWVDDCSSDNIAKRVAQLEAQKGSAEL